jgi:hypothetical protein
MLESQFNSSSRQIAFSSLWVAKIVFAKPALFSNLVLTKELLLSLIRLRLGFHQ